MELRHLRYFVTLAEELHFTRAAERLHIEQPPLSRAIKELEDELGVVLFDRNRRGTLLTQAGAVFLEDVRRVFTVLEHARENVRSVAAGLQGSLRIVISDGAIAPQLGKLLARCREEEPEIEIRLLEVPLAEQLRGLRSGDFSLGFAHTADVGDGIIAEPVWRDTLVVLVPTHHPLLVHKEIPLLTLATYPLVLCDPERYEGAYRELSRVLEPLGPEPKVVEHVSSLDLMLSLVGAGYGIGFTTMSTINGCQRHDVVIRPLAVESSTITTYLLRLDNVDPPAALKRFIARVHEGWKG